MRCTGEIVFLCGAIKVRQRKVVTAFNDEAAGFLCSEFYTAATGNTVVEFILNLNSVYGFLCIG